MRPVFVIYTSLIICVVFLPLRLILITLHFIKYLVFIRHHDHITTTSVSSQKVVPSLNEPIPPEGSKPIFQKFSSLQLNTSQPSVANSCDPDMIHRPEVEKSSSILFLLLSIPPYLICIIWSRRKYEAFSSYICKRTFKINHSSNCV